MENASKALIIAGAILLAIVIISLGLIVVNNSRNAVDSANMNEQEIQTFNSKFTSYEGTKTGTQVKALIQVVIASNQANPSHVVKINDNDATAYDTNSLTASSSKKITLVYENGYVTNITIS